MVILWVRLEDTFYDHPKILAAGNAAVGLYCRALSYACHHLTDGFIPLSFLKGQLKTAERLVLHGLWERAENGYTIRNYLKFQPSAESVMFKREAARVRVNNARSSQEVRSLDIDTDIDTDKNPKDTNGEVPISSEQRKDNLTKIAAMSRDLAAKKSLVTP